MTNAPPEAIELPDETDDSYSLDGNGFFDEAEYSPSPLPIKSAEDDDYVDFGPPIIPLPANPGRTPALSPAYKGAYKPFGSQAKASGNDDGAEKEEKPPEPLTKSLDVGVALITKPPQRVFSLPCLRAGTVGGLISQGGAGKSMLAMQLSLMLATGVDTFKGIASHTGWQNLMGGPVLYASFEDGEDDAAYRLHNIWSSLGTLADANALAAAKQNLSVETRTSRIPDLLDPDWGDWLTEACNERLLVIIDTLRTSHMADENDSAAMSRLLATMQSSVIENKQCAILFLHHASKAGSAKDQRDKQQAARGSSVITDNARGQFYLNGLTAEDVDPNKGQIYDPYAPGELAEIPLHETEPNDGTELFKRYARFGVAKSNYAAPWPTVTLRRDDRGVLSYVPAFQSVPTLGKPASAAPKQPKPKPPRGNITV